MDEVILKCTACSGDFDIIGEGGIEGQIGILPMQFCPTCLNGIFEMVDYIRGEAL